MIRAGLVALALGASCLLTGCSSQDGGASSGSAAADGSAATVTPEILERGRTLYKTHCAACHGEGGKGDGPAASAMKPPPRDHTDRAYMSTLTDQDLVQVISLGGAIRGKPLMPPNPQITGRDLHALVAFTRSLSTPAQ